MSRGSAFGMILLAVALGAGVWLALKDGIASAVLWISPAGVLLLFLIPVLCAGVLLSARRHRQK